MPRSQSLSQGAPAGSQVHGLKSTKEMEIIQVSRLDMFFLACLKDATPKKRLETQEMANANSPSVNSIYMVMGQDHGTLGTLR